MEVPVIRFRDAWKRYHMAAETVEALKGVDVDIRAGQFVAVMGPSGSGKSTMMHIAGLLDSLTGGRYELNGEDVSAIGNAKQADIRNKKIGFIFQSFDLLSRCSALENVELPMLYHRPPIADWKERANHLPTQLSGGQHQRVAIARALVNEPALILADEPTGNLDTHTGRDIMNVLASLNDKGITIILVTHDPEVGRQAHRRIWLRDGQIEKDEMD